MDTGHVARYLPTGKCWSDPTPLNPQDTHVAVCLLTEEVASMLGAQIIVPGTLRSSYAREAGFNTGVNTPQLACPVRTPTGQNYTVVLEPLRVGLATHVPDVEPPAQVAMSFAGWCRQMLGFFGALTLDADGARRRFPHAPPSASGGGSTQRFREGEVVAVSGAGFVVLSNDVIHTNFADAALVAPLVPMRSDLKSSLCDQYEGWRIVWERTRAVRAAQMNHGLPSGAPQRIPREVLDEARLRFAELASGISPTEKHKVEWKKYLARSARDCPPVHGVEWEAPSTSIWPKGREVDSHAEMLSASRMFTHGASAFGGESYIPLPLESEVFNLWLHRTDDDVELIVEPADSDVDEVDSAWIEEGVGAVTRTLVRAESDETGVARLPLGKIDVDKPLALTIGVSCRGGVEEFSVRHTWHRSSE